MFFCVFFGRLSIALMDRFLGDLNPSIAFGYLDLLGEYEQLPTSEIYESGNNDQ